MKEMGFVEFVAMYDAPRVEVLEVEVEKGFAASGDEGETGDVNTGA